MAPRLALVPASYVLFVRSERGRTQILLQRRTGTGYMDDYWASAAAGHIEQGESVFEAGAREAGEELGVTDLRLRPLCAMHRTGGESPVEQRVDYFLLATEWAGDPSIREPAKCADLRWFDLDALPDPVVPHELRVIRDYASGSLEPILTDGF